MKTKKNPKTVQALKFIALLPFVLLVLVAFSSCAAKKKAGPVQTEIAPPPPPPPPPPPAKASESKANILTVREESVDEEDIPFVVVEEMPIFPGGDEALLKFIAENTTYPKASKDQKIEGRVIARFCVTSKGGVDRISVLHSVSPELDAEAIRVIGLLPAFKPGRQGGKDVPVWYMVPMSFALK
jgi:TonB family protein